jgi:C-terminal processing protease CtpA/Prc
MTDLTVTLERGPNGLGFHIKGGVDERDHHAITISTISESGAAAADGHLKVGDCILAVNGKSLEKLTHAEAVELFRTSGDSVTVTVLRESEKTDCTKLISTVTVVGFAAALIIGFVAFMWHKKNK